MKKVVVGVIFFLFSCLGLLAQDITVRLHSVHDLNLHKESVKAHLTLSMPHTGIEPKMQRDVRILNAREIKVTNEYIEETKEGRMLSINIEAELVQALDMSDFPYDVHQITILISEPQDEKHDGIEIKEHQFKLNPKLEIIGWRVSNQKVREVPISQLHKIELYNDDEEAEVSVI